MIACANTDRATSNQFEIIEFPIVNSPKAPGALESLIWQNNWIAIPNRLPPRKIGKLKVPPIQIR